MAGKFQTGRTPAQIKAAEKSYRHDVLHPSSTWHRQLKAAAANGSIRELRLLEMELHGAISRLEGFLQDQQYYATPFASGKTGVALLIEKHSARKI